jgi:hypothetical protein
VPRGIFGNILKTRGLHGNFGDYGLITKKPRGLFAKFAGYVIFGFIFELRNP